MKVIYITLGFIFFGLGAIGAFLPVLPTTPFLLLSSACFARGSDRFNDWFTSTKLYKKHLETYYESRAMTVKTKASLLTLATSMMVLSFLAMPNKYGKIFMAGMIVFLYYYFFFQIKTIKEPVKE
ncbi:YbaN family protein [Proteiniclasticum aestuarii]|uniref:YbaN family protein n=1 Tax=Proteiniclasticum aestuarii TaxID=2817862 RepID=UPI001F61C475|nr:YbaN family protein [Proteiniclasticum aestuarii]